ncbi:heavy-metal-associated domain-containing protein [Pseudogemmobacter sonorensis]|uniref:heavy-metal-associated domain-containing protein n=1 Tax=Pseudogemmobacter sonorensis TaxID=2989681 RepID=UPI0036B82A66
MTAAATTILSVPDMSCGHCRASVEAALAPLARRVEIDLPARRVTVEGGETAPLLRALEAIGFPASEVPAK